MKVGLLSVRFAGVRLGIRRGKIVDSADCLGVGLCGGWGSTKEKAHGFSHRGPLVCVGATTGVSRQSKWINLNRIQ
jgi:hypothetical protein